MNKWTTYLFFRFLLLTGLIFIIQNKLICSQEDSVLKKFPEVIVTTDKENSTISSKYLGSSLIDFNKIELINPVQISEIFASVPGMFIKDYGGLGGIKTISMLGCTAQQTAVTLDGIQLNSTQNGITDLSLLPASIIESAEIIRGGSSSINGSGAMNGSVNLITMHNFGNKLNIKAGLGSFKEKTISIQGSFKKNDIVLGAFIDFLGSDGNYSFETNQFGKIINAERKNGDFSNTSASLSIGKISEKIQITARAIFINSSRGTPGAVFQGHIESPDARLNEQNLFAYCNVILIPDTNSNLRFNLSSRLNNIRYNDDELVLLTGFADGKYFNKNINFNTELNYKVKDLNNNLFLGYEFSDLNGANLNLNENGYVIRHNLNAGVKSEVNLGKISDFVLSWMFSSRVDYFSDAGFSFSPFIGANARNSSKNIEIKSGISYNFRPPSFNELYYLNYGNTDLKPEKSVSFLVGVLFDPFEIMNISTDLFYVLTKDRIISTPKNPLIWTAKNYGEVVSKGVNVSAGLTLFEKLLSLKVAYTLQFTTDENIASPTKGKQIVYVPQELLYSSLNLNFNQFNLGSDFHFTGFRFALPDNSFESLLESFYTINAYLDYKLYLKSMILKFRIDALNILDNRYSVIMNYPMPGRMFRFTVFYNLDWK